jgi:hypothetical protein
MSTLINASSFKNLVANWSNESGENIWQKEYNEYINPLFATYDAAAYDANYDYKNAIGQAYDTYVANKRSSEFSNLGTGDILNLGKSYSEAYAEASRQYRKNYESTIEKIEETRMKTAINYAETMNEQQESIAQGYADFFNSFYDYLSNVYSQYGTDESLFGTTSPLSQFISNGELLTRSDIYNKFITENENGTYTLTEDALKYVQMINSLKDYGKIVNAENLSNLQSFQDYLAENAPDIEKFATKYGEKFYKDIGFKSGSLNAYDTSIYNKWVPEGTYSHDNINYDINWRAGRNLDVMVNDKWFDLEYSKSEVNNNIVRALNIQTTGKGDTVPADNTIQIYNNVAYVYDDGWRELVSDKDDVDDLIKTWRDYTTGQSDKVGTTFYRTDYLNGEVEIDGERVPATPVPSNVSDELDEEYGHNIGDRNERYRDDGKRYVFKHNGRYYVKLFDNRTGNNTWFQLEHYNPS